MPARIRFARPLLPLGALIIGFLMLIAPLPAVAQTCSLCYSRADSSGNRMIQALRSGILILIAPPTLMSLGMILIVYRKRNQFRQCNEAHHSGSNW